MQTRIYLPLSGEALRRLAGGGVVEPAPLTAYAVTAELRHSHPGADEEELEYLAFSDAAGSASERGGPRVVAAADVEADDVAPLPDGREVASAVRVATEVPRRRVVSFHVGEEAAPGSAAAGIPAFSWYDATELDVVLDLLG